MDLKIKRQIEYLDNIFSFLKIYPPKRDAAGVNQLYSVYNDYKNKGTLYTEQAIDTLTKLYDSLSFPELDLVNEIQLIIRAVGLAIQKKQLTKKQESDIRYEIKELQDSYGLYSDESLQKLQHFWNKFKLPDLGQTQNALLYQQKQLDFVSPSTLRENGVDISGYSNFYKKRTLDNVKFVQDLTKREIKFYPLDSNKNSNLEDLPSSSKGLVEYYFEELKDITGLTPVLEER